VENKQHFIRFLDTSKNGYNVLAIFGSGYSVFNLKKKRIFYKYWKSFIGDIDAPGFQFPSQLILFSAYQEHVNDQ
jgi:hypothetical protein